MNKEDIIIITGANGFIGSCFLSFLNDLSFKNLILVDDFKNGISDNLIGKKYLSKINIFELEKVIESLNFNYFFHFGANSDTTELDYEIHEKYNLNYSKMVWKYCTLKKVPLIYASSAATYGNGEYGYNDEHYIINKLQPLNPYGLSKHNFDKWCINQNTSPPYWFGLKFFNVYGPNEYHKNNMSSIILKNFNHIKEKNKAILYKSHNNNYKDGDQKRDFIYIKDLNKIIYWLITNLPKSGLYNVGSGVSRTYKELVKIMFDVMNIEENIEYIPTPSSIINNYQYFTEANMNKLYSAGFDDKLYSLEEGIGDYIKNYLNKNSFL